MFDIGFSELLLFGVIALIVLGPEKLPQAARTAGQWYAKIRRTVSTLQSEIEAELDLAETRQQMQKELAKIRQTEAEMRREMAEMRGSMQAFESSQNQHLKAEHQPITDKAQHTNHQDNAEKGDSSPVSPKAFDYAYDSYGADEALTAPELSDTQGRDDSDAQSIIPATTQSRIQRISTKPWENMWFRLGAYDKARRLPQAPYLPNYKADILLNSPANQLHSPLAEQAAVDKQEHD